MAQLLIDHALCIGCGICKDSCAVNALYLEKEKACVNENCVLCGVCVDACPTGAISIQKKPDGKKTEQRKHIWVIAEQHDGEILPVTYELLGKGRTLADEKKEKLIAVLCGAHVEKQTLRLIEKGADEVLLCDDAAFENVSEQLYYDTICGLMKEYKPDIVLFGATSFGRSIAPRIAARLQTGLTADCTMLEMDMETGLLKQTRPAFGGNLMATIVCPQNRPQMATVRPGVMRALEKPRMEEGNVSRVACTAAEDGAITILENITATQNSSVANAKLIVSVGKGLGAQKNMKLVRELADLLGASVGVTRPLVDAGWGEYQHQIGQTGVAVAPDLLLMFGISGAIQHVAGITNAKKIIAVNTDPDAPIFQIADYGIVGDCVELIKAMIQKLK